MLREIFQLIIQRMDPEDQSEEMCVLEHRIRVLQSTVDNQNNRIKVLQTKLDDQENLLQECSAQLISKTEEHSSLESSYHKLLDKLQQLEEVKDLQDELDHRNEDLKKAEKSLSRYQSEVEALQGYRKKATELEKKVMYYETVETKAKENEQVSITEVNNSRFS